MQTPGGHRSIHLSAVFFLSVNKFAVARKWQSDKPPGMIVDGSVCVTGEKPMEAHGDTTPKNPSLKVGLVRVEDGVVGEPELESPQAELHRLTTTSDNEINSRADCQTMVALSSQLNDSEARWSNFLAPWFSPEPQT